ncbi:MAG TPA: acylphosphatase [Marinobacterium sp.]|nr:acylphosphatase [Marinobacterium sp.]
MEQKLTLHLLISGRVQGVWFRQFARQQAESYGVCGYVRNLPNGRVEAVLSGESGAVRQVEAWLNKGPELALVTEVEAAEVSYQPFEEFEVRR